MIEKRWREGKEKNTRTRKKSREHEIQKKARERNVPGLSTYQYTSYARATIIPLLARGRKVSHEKEEPWSGQLCRREKRSFHFRARVLFFPLLLFLDRVEKKMHSVTGKQNTDADRRSKKEVYVCVHMCMRTCVYVSVYVRMYVRACVRACVRVCACVCVYARIYVCTCVKLK